MQSRFVLTIALGLGVVSYLVPGGATEARAFTEERVTIEFWDVQNVQGTYTEVAVDLMVAYNETHEQTRVQYQVIPWDGWYQLFFSAVLSGNGPDVSGGAFPQPIQYAQLGEILFLDPIVAAWRNDDPGVLASFAPGTLELYQYDGRQAGLPRFVDPRVITYRTDLMEKAGVVDLPTTWTEFEETLRAIRDKTGITPLVFRAGDIMGFHVLLYFLLQTGTGILTESAEPLHDLEAVEMTLAFLRRLYRDGLIAEDAVVLKGRSARDRYLAGGAAMVFSYPFTQEEGAATIIERSAVLPPIVGSGSRGTRAVLTWIAPIMAYRQSDSPREALEFIRWWVENNAPIWTVGRFPFLPVRVSLWEPQFLGSNRMLAQVAERVMPHAVLPTWPQPSLYPEFHRIEGENVLGSVLVDVLAGRVEPRAAAVRLQSEIREILHAQ